MIGRDVVDAVSELFARAGGELYFGEAVTQRAHALQCAWLAERDGAPEALIVAALLHDVGHLIHGLPESVADAGVDAHHEEAGQAWLSSYFGPDVTEPVRLHVEAKRFLCGSDPGYLEALSPASRQSLELQGGPFDRSGLASFAEQPFAHEAVRLRRWDDRAKTPGLEVPDLDHYALMMVQVSRNSSKRNM